MAQEVPPELSPEVAAALLAGAARQSGPDSPLQLVDAGVAIGQDKDGNKALLVDLTARLSLPLSNPRDLARALTGGVELP